MICIFDISNSHPAVLAQLGLALGFNKTNIVLEQSFQTTDFPLAEKIIYDSFENLEGKLIQRLQFLLSEKRLITLEVKMKERIAALAEVLTELSKLGVDIVGSNSYTLVPEEKALWMAQALLPPGVEVPEIEERLREKRDLEIEVSQTKIERPLDYKITVSVDISGVSEENQNSLTALKKMLQHLEGVNISIKHHIRRLSEKDLNLDEYKNAKKIFLYILWCHNNKRECRSVDIEKKEELKIIKDKKIFVGTEASFKKGYSGLRKCLEKKVLRFVDEVLPSPETQRGQGQGYKINAYVTFSFP